MDAGAIVVGAGHNGLICAAYLARAGLSVLVLEARDLVGGCSATESDLGARFNLCNCDHFAVRSTPIMEELSLADHGLRYLDLTPSMQHVFWNGERSWRVFHDVDQTIEELARTHPAEVANYRRYLDMARPIARFTLDMALDVPDASQVTRVLRRRRGAGSLHLLQWSRLSSAAVLKQFFSAEALLAPVVATGPTVWGLSPDTPGTGLGALGYALKHLVAGGRPVGGSGALAAAVRSACEASGGVVRTGAVVDAIVCEHGRVAGVRLTDGTVLRSSVVIVASDPRVAIVDQLRGAPRSADRMIWRWRTQPPVPGYESKIDAVISVLPRYRDLDGDDTLTATTVFTPTLSQLAEAHARMGQGEVSATPVFLANIPSVLDPSLQPGPTTHVFSLEALFTPYAVRGGWPNSSEPQRWLEAYASRLDNGPEFLAGIGAHRAMTPDRYERDLHMPQGHATSFGGRPLATVLGRPRELTRYRTGVPGLFLTGAATFPGAGVWGASGRNCAKVVLASR